MTASSSLLNEIGHRHGLSDLKVLYSRETEAVKKDTGRWREFVDEPISAVVTATKLKFVSSFPWSKVRRSYFDESRLLVVSIVLLLLIRPVK